MACFDEVCMLLKQKDGKQRDVRELHRLLGLGVSPEQRQAIELELSSLALADSSEQKVAMYLDFVYKDASNWALIHDLRIEHRGEIAQIDHLLINRFLDVYVLESKNYHQGVKIDEQGQFLLWDGKDYHPIESPYELNKKHIQLLKLTVGHQDLGPRRLDFPIPIKYRNVILFAPTSNLVKPPSASFDLSSVVNVNAFVALAESNVATKSELESSKMVGVDTLRDFGERLVRQHCHAVPVDYAGKFNVVLDRGGASAAAGG